MVGKDKETESFVNDLVGVVIDELKQDVAAEAEQKLFAAVMGELKKKQDSIIEKAIDSLVDETITLTEKRFKERISQAIIANSSNIKTAIVNQLSEDAK